MIRISAFLLAFLGLSSLSLQAQVTGISYQAVIMNPGGKDLPGKNQADNPLANQEICLKFSFKSGVGTTGVVEYEETHVIETDAYGMVNLTLGLGTPVGGTFASFDLIPWISGTKFLEVNLDKSGTCANYTMISDQAFTAVPFALYAVNSPPGPQGPPGAVGAPGPQGPVGPAATTAVLTGATGLPLTTGVIGILPIANGGTEANTAAGAKTNLGLGNVDNTADLNKPISTATQTALNTKEDLSNKSTATTLGTSDVLYPTQNAVKIYVDGEIVNNATPDATTLTKGKIQLAGDLRGTAASPEVAPGVINNSKLANGAVTTDKIANAAVTNDKIAAGINATKLADGSVTNTALQFIGTLTSDAQAQINALNTAGTSTSTAISTNTTNIATNTSDINDLKTLASGNIYIGDATNTAIERALSGDVTLTNSGLATIANNAITTLKIADAAVTNNKLAPGIDATKLADGSVTNTELQFIGTLTSNAQDQINALNTSSSTAISLNTIGINELKTLANGKIYVGNVSDIATEVEISGDLTLSNTGAATIATDAVTAPKIVNAAVTNNKLAPGIDATKLADGSVTNTELQFIGTLTSNAQDQINALNTSSSTAISLNTIGINELKTLANGKIYVGNVSDIATEVEISGDLTLSNTGAATIATDAVTTPKILAAAVTNEKLAAGIDAAKLTDNSVFDIKIVSVSGSKVTGNISGNALNVTGTVAVANGGTSATTAAEALTNLGGTTVGGNFFTLSNPSAITFPRINADNTIAALTAADFRSAIGAGTSSTSGTVTSVASLTLGTTGIDLSSSVANGATTPVITLNVPDASPTARGVITTGNQTIAGTKTFNSAIVDDLKVTLLSGNSATPTWTPGGASVGVTTVDVVGTNLAGTVTIEKTNNNGNTGDFLVKVTYAGTPFTNGSYPILYPANAAAAALASNQQVFAIGTNTDFTINIGTLAPSGSPSSIVTYKWNYHVIGN